MNYKVEGEISLRYSLYEKININTFIAFAFLAVLNIYVVFNGIHNTILNIGMTACNLMVLLSLYIMTSKKFVYLTEKDLEIKRGKHVNGLIFMCKYDIIEKVVLNLKDKTIAVILKDEYKHIEHNQGDVKIFFPSYYRSALEYKAMEYGFKLDVIKKEMVAQ